MKPSINSSLLKEYDIQDFLTNEERTYYSKKLHEAEKYNTEHPEILTSDEFHKKISEKYRI